MGSFQNPVHLSGQTAAHTRGHLMGIYFDNSQFKRVLFTNDRLYGTICA